MQKASITILLCSPCVKTFTMNLDSGGIVDPLPLGCPTPHWVSKNCWFFLWGVKPSSHPHSRFSVPSHAAAPADFCLCAIPLLCPVYMEAWVVILVLRLPHFLSNFRRTKIKNPSACPFRLSAVEPWSSLLHISFAPILEYSAPAKSLYSLSYKNAFPFLIIAHPTTPSDGLFFMKILWKFKWNLLYEPSLTTSS